VSSFVDLFRRIRLSPVWVALQFGLTLLLMLLGLAWTRLPDKHVWQVALTLLVPVLLAISVLELEAGTMRALADDDGRRVKLVVGACTLLVWVALFWACWAVLDWCDDRIPEWAGYLNSRASAGGRATIFTYEHLQRWLTQAEWLLRWIIVPGKIVPYAVASAQWGWRVPFRKIIRLLLSWRWWPAVVLAALAGVVLPGHFFAGVPHGTVSHQVWAVALKLVGSYVLAVCSWVLLLGWAAVMLARQPDPAEDALDAELIRRLQISRGWIVALAGWVVLGVVSNQALARIPGDHTWEVSVSFGLTVFVRTVLIVGFLVLQVSVLRVMIGDEAKRSRFVWSMLSVMIWIVMALATVFLASLCGNPVLEWVLDWVVTPALLGPFAAASANWGVHLPWGRVLSMLRDWRWWLGMLPAAVIMWGFPALFAAVFWGETTSQSPLNESLVRSAYGLLRLGGWILLLAWAAVILGRGARGSEQGGDDSLVPVPLGSGPLREDAVRLPLPEGGEDAGGDA
jgi:hypothetical protein